MLGRLGRHYRRMLCRHPLLVQSIQTGILMSAGDLIAQKVIEQKCELDYLRNARFLALGTLTVGPALTVWYRFLSRAVGDSGKSVALKKMALDQLIFAPTFLAFFIVALSMLEGKDFECAKKELCYKYKDILMANYKLWPATQLFNFYFTPLAYQVLFVQTVALGWNTYLSWKTEQKIDSDD